MKREATVVEVDGRLMAEVVRTEACLQCHACQYGQKGRVLVELPEGDYRVGDTVELSLEDARFARASLVAYALPVATLFLGLLIAAFAGLSRSLAGALRARRAGRGPRRDQDIGAAPAPVAPGRAALR